MILSRVLCEDYGHDDEAVRENVRVQNMYLPFEAAMQVCRNLLISNYGSYIATWSISWDAEKGKRNVYIR